MYTGLRLNRSHHYEKMKNCTVNYTVMLNILLIQMCVYFVVMLDSDRNIQITEDIMWMLDCTA